MAQVLKSTSKVDNSAMFKDKQKPACYQHNQIVKDSNDITLVTPACFEGALSYQSAGHGYANGVIPCIKCLDLAKIWDESLICHGFIRLYGFASTMNLQLFGIIVA